MSARMTPSKSIICNFVRFPCILLLRQIFYSLPMYSFGVKWKLSFKENHSYNDKIELPIRDKNSGFDLDCINEILLNTFKPNFHVNLNVWCIFEYLNYVQISKHKVKCINKYATISDPTRYEYNSSLAEHSHYIVLACEFTG